VTTHLTHPPTEPTELVPVRWFTGRSELIVSVLVLGLAVFLTVGTVTMAVPEGSGTPGPQFFPTIVAGMLYLLAILLAIQVIRAPRTVDGDSNVGLTTDLLTDIGDIDTTSELRVVRSSTRPTTRRRISATDWRTTGYVFGALVGFVLILQPVGWLLSASALFWAIARALGSRRPVFDVGVSVIFSSFIQLAFSAGLGLNLPSGILTGVLSWIN
jgi:putative tricarboxylic transport membrane protein